jgi:hypothetical protein
MIRWLLIILGGFALAWLWIFFGSRHHCPVCAAELPDDWADPGRKLQRCWKCGWERGESR